MKIKPENAIDIIIQYKIGEIIGSVIVIIGMLIIWQFVIIPHDNEMRRGKHNESDDLEELSKKIENERKEIQFQENLVIESKKVMEYPYREMVNEIVEEQWKKDEKRRQEWNEEREKQKNKKKKTESEKDERIRELEEEVDELEQIIRDHCPESDF